MKLVRYGERGAEKPGILDAEGKIRDLSGVIEDVAGEVLGPDGLKQLKGLEGRRSGLGLPGFPTLRG